MLDEKTDELCISKLLGWEKKITIEKKNIDKVFETKTGLHLINTIHI